MKYLWHNLGSQKLRASVKRTARLKINKIQITWLKGTLQIDQPIDRNCSLKIMILGINLPARPHSAQLTISSGSPVFLFILESPRQKSQQADGLILPSGPRLGPCWGPVGGPSGFEPCGFLLEFPLPGVPVEL